MSPNVIYNEIKLFLMYLDAVDGNLRTNQKRKKEQKKERREGGGRRKKGGRVGGRGEETSHCLR